jgi:bifunctional DNase/RNase
MDISIEFIASAVLADDKNLILLRRKRNDDLTFFFNVSSYQREVLSSTLRKEEFERPLYNQFVASFIVQAGFHLIRAVIDRGKENGDMIDFYAHIEVEKNGEILSVDISPCDAVLVALAYCNLTGENALICVNEGPFTEHARRIHLSGIDPDESPGPAGTDKPSDSPDKSKDPQEGDSFKKWLDSLE